MNKQEFQQTIKNMKCEKDCIYMTSYNVYEKGFEKARELALLHSNSLDEPEKPVVPQFIADWLEFCNKRGYPLNFIMAVNDRSPLIYGFKGDVNKCKNWANNHQKETAEAWLFGYEVEKEKLYTVELPNPNCSGFYSIILRRDNAGKIYISASELIQETWKGEENAQLTESEIKEDFDLGLAACRRGGK